MTRNQSIPFGLPIVWARLARFDHAEALARTIIDPGVRIQALAPLVTVVAHAGDLDRADADFARTIVDPGPRRSADQPGNRPSR